MPTEIYNPFTAGMLNVTQKDYCLNTCYDIIKEEVGKELGLDIRAMIFFAFLGVGWVVIKFYLSKKYSLDDPVYKKVLSLYLNVAGIIGTVLFIISLKLTFALPSLF